MASYSLSYLNTTETISTGSGSPTCSELYRLLGFDQIRGEVLIERCELIQREDVTNVLIGANDDDGAAVAVDLTQMIAYPGSPPGPGYCRAGYRWSSLLEKTFS